VPAIAHGGAGDAFAVRDWLVSASGGHRAGRCLEQHLGALPSFRIGPRESLEVCRSVQGGVTELDGLDGGTGTLVARLRGYDDDRRPSGCGRADVAGTSERVRW
jgi:hypothetical protein